eukprot:2106605-Heterocapsa_arctica.AAC.1
MRPGAPQQSWRSRMHMQHRRKVAHHPQEVHHQAGRCVRPLRFSGNDTVIFSGGATGGCTEEALGK